MSEIHSPPKASAAAAPPTPAPAPTEVPSTSTLAPSELTATPSTDAPSTVPPPTGPNGAPLSKNQLKKLARKAKLAETRDTWKALKKEKAAARKLRKKAAYAAMTPSELAALQKDRKPKIPVKHEDTGVTIVLDCGFDELMTENEIVSMASQLTRCYSANRQAEKQVKLEVTGFNGRLRKRYEENLGNTHLHWKGVTFSEGEYEVGDDVVYLTADTTEEVEVLQPGMRYIVGGIVDRNRYKNLCRDKAVKQGVRMARLPIGQYIKMASRQVLTTNQVVEIMIGVLQNGGDWEDAFVKVIPKRKGGVKKSEVEEDEEDYEEDYEEGDEEEKEDEEMKDVEEADGAEQQLQGEDAASRATSTEAVVEPSKERPT